MSLFSEPFKQVKNGAQTIEVRLFDRKRMRVKLGDTIIFTRLPDRSEKITVKVFGLSRFRSFYDLFSTFEATKFGHKEGIMRDEQVKRMYKYYTPKDEQKYGVVGMHIKLARASNKRV
jgi:ASC-1-like (ASCH) protein